MDDYTQSRLSARKISSRRPLPNIYDDVASGLIEVPRSMPPKYFYDDRGSHLFDAICETREYYPTRTEERLLECYSSDIIDRVQPQHIVEFGSGTARKTRHLFNACDASGTATSYWPLDVCEEMLRKSGEQLVREYDWLRVNALVGDYLGGLADLPRLEGPSLYLFLGGTIGNFTAQQARQFLDEVRALMKPGDYLVVGADRVKDSDILHAAYNDAAGITAQFNLNLLDVLNRELDADFDTGQFEHKALFNSDASQIEMYLVSSRSQSVYLRAMDCTLEFGEGEHILTEISRKFTADRLEDMMGQAGFTVEHHFEPENGYFSLLLARPD